MNKQCEIIRDIMPLYVDDACSSSSAEMIKEHLSECDECTRIYQAIKSDKYEMALRLEKEEVIAHHAKTEKRKTMIVGASIAGILCIPIIVCLIVNLAVGHGLDWFFIVFTSLMVFASLVVVPLVVEKKKLLCTIFSFTISLMLLLFTCAIFTQGNWFLVTGTSVLFGLSVIFTPYIAYTLPLPKFLKNNKGFFSLSIDTILFAVMMLCIGYYIDNAVYWEIALPIVLYSVGFFWIIFLVCRYIKVSKFIRGGIASILIGGYTFSVNNVINLILDNDIAWPKLNLYVWNDNTIDGNVKWLTLLAGIFIGLICIAIGIVHDINSKKDN